MAVRVRATICVKRQIVQKNALQRNKSSISALPLSINFIIIIILNQYHMNNFH